MLDVTIILINYKTVDLCIDAVNSVMEKTEGVKYEIIVVDNGATDYTMSILKAELPTQVKLIKSETNLGFGKANNLAMEKAQGEFVFLLNTDTLLVNNAIKILYDYIKSDESIGVVGGNLYDAELFPAHSFMKKWHSIKDFSRFAKICHGLKKVLLGKKKRDDFNWTENTMDVAYITGADMMTRKSVIDEVGGFDKDFFMYFEESELSYRIKKAGYRIVSVPEAKIIHLEGLKQGEDGFSEKRFSMFVNGMFLFYQKVYGEKHLKKLYKAHRRELNFVKLFKRKQKDIIKKKIKIISDEYSNWRVPQQKESK